MTDNAGDTVYSYNSLSQLTSETRHFNKTLTAAPETGNGFKLQYTYSIAGQLASLTDPFGDEIEYEHDNLGRLSSVTGSTFGGVSTYGENAAYRAFDALKSLDYGDTFGMSMNYDDRQLPTYFKVSKTGTTVIEKNYEYYNDGRLRYSQDVLNEMFDRSYTNDSLGQLFYAESGAPARGETDSPDHIPYSEVYLHNAFGQLTNRITQHWTGEFGWSQSFQNNRGADSEYDADGRPLRVGSSTSGDELHYVYDAAGQITKTTATANNYTDHTIDGNGLVVEQVKYYWLPSPESFNTVANIDTLFIRSSVLGGQTVTEAWGSDFGADVDAGEKCRTFVRAGGTDLAIQYEGQGTAPDQVLWDHRDPSNSTMRMTDSTGAIPGGIGGPNSMEMDPMGASVQFEDPYVLPDPAQPNPGSSNLFPYLTSPSYTRPEIVWMGIPISYEFYLDLFHNGMIHGPFGMLRSAYGYIGTTSEPGVRSPEAPNTPVPDVVTDWYFSLPWWTTLIPAAQPNPGGQLPTTRFPVSSVLSGCKFKVSISNNNNLKKAELDALQKEIARIYAKAGQEIEFTTTGFADYFLGLNATASGYVTKSDKTVGQTGFNGPNVFNRGQVFIDRLVLSAKDDNVVSGSKDYFNQNSKSRAIGLARAGSHEIGHFLLQQNYDSGDIEGVMHDGFIGKQWTGADKANQGIWEFTPAQIKQLNSLCGR